MDIKTKLSIDDILNSNNVAELLSEDDLNIISNNCLEGYATDEESRKEFIEELGEIRKLTSSAHESKTFPWPNAANIKLPSIQQAAIKFAVKVLGELFRNKNFVEPTIVGTHTDEKIEKAKRVADYISYQLTVSERSWKSDTDKLLHVLPIEGHIYRKRDFSPTKLKTVSEICKVDEVCVSSEADCANTAKRTTHIIPNKTYNELVSFIKSGAWLDVQDKLEKDIDPNQTYTIYEQCCWLDLDGDGYDEPYVVTLEKDSEKVVRILPRFLEEDIGYNKETNELMSICPAIIYVDYMLMPSWIEGRREGMGFGSVLLNLLKPANAITNQLIDAGTLRNAGGGFLSNEIKIPSGDISMHPGKWTKTRSKSVDFQNGFFPNPSPDPSPTMFQLLGLMIELGNDLVNSADIMSRDIAVGNMPATTVMALVEQSNEVFGAIYARVFESMTLEIEQLYKLNYRYLDDVEYGKFLDSDSISRNDFKSDDQDVRLTADPTIVSKMQRVAKSEALLQGLSLPGINPEPIVRYWLQSLDIPMDLIEDIMTPPEQEGPNPVQVKFQQETEFKMADIQIKEQELELKKEELELKKQKSEMENLEKQTKALKNVADAEATETGSQLNIYQNQINQLKGE